MLRRQAGRVRAGPRAGLPAWQVLPRPAVEGPRQREPAPCSGQSASQRGWAWAVAGGTDSPGAWAAVAAPPPLAAEPPLPPRALCCPRRERQLRHLLAAGLRWLGPWAGRQPREIEAVSARLAQAVAWRQVLLLPPSLLPLPLLAPGLLWLTGRGAEPCSAQRAARAERPPSWGCFAARKAGPRGRVLGGPARQRTLLCWPAAARSTRMALGPEGHAR